MTSKRDPNDPNSADTVLAPSGSAPSASTSSVATSSAAPELLAGRYLIQSLVGRGGMGAVYKAKDTELDEIVALKVLKPELAASPDLIERFRREVKLARRVTHPNVARTYDIGEHEGTKFLTMEYIDGESLADMLKRGSRLSDSRGVEIARAVCAGLSAAHRAGVVHRDLKPDNVIVSRDGRAVITDFGIARDPLAAAAGQTIGAVVGTPAYMAPEQVDGKSPIDARADIYALGVLLYELFTYELPWQGNSVLAVAAARLFADPPDPRARRPELSDTIAEVVLRCMAREPERRFADALEVSELLSTATPTSTGAATNRGSVAPPSATKPVLHEKSVAVLPFRNQGPPEDEYVADGLTEDLIDTLSMTAGLRVRPRGAITRFKGVDADPRVVGKELDVEVVVEGSVRRASGQVRLTARLLSVEDGFQLWAQRFQRPANDLLVISDETAHAIAEALTVHARPQHAGARDTLAADLYLRARAELTRRGPVDTARAIDLFRQAHERAPDDVAILSGYARAWARRWFFEGKSGEEAIALAERAVQRAPNDPEAQLALATVRLVEGNIGASAAACQRGFTLAPDKPEALEFRGRLLLEAGRPELSIPMFEAALHAEPDVPNARLEIVRAHALMGDFVRAKELFDQRPKQGEPSQGEIVFRARIALWSPVLLPLLEGIEAQGNAAWTTPAGVIRVAKAISSGENLASVLAELDAAVGAFGGARRFSTVVRQILTEFQAHAGNVDSALAHLEYADAAGLFDATWMERCPALAPLRASPRFAVVNRSIQSRAGIVRDALGV